MASSWLMYITVERLNFTEPSEVVPRGYNCRYHNNTNVLILLILSGCIEKTGYKASSTDALSSAGLHRTVKVDDN